MGRTKEIENAAYDAAETQAVQYLNQYKTQIGDIDEELYVQGYTDGFEDGAEYADKNPVSPWISIKDKLPEKDDDIFVTFMSEGKRWYTWLKGYLVLDCIEKGENFYDYWMYTPKI